MKKFCEIAIIYIPAAFLLISVTWVLTYRWTPIKWTPLMLARTVENMNSDNYINRQIWVSKEDVSQILIDAILLAEDQRFYSHNGFDLIELETMMTDHVNYGKEIRGCSTISQQVAKNCFTFGSHTLLRKAIEAYYTVLIELLWGKERILEVYLNVVETGRGLFGVEAACQRYFGTDSSNISISDAVALACVLPKPLTRTPNTVLYIHPQKHAIIAKQLGKTLTK